MHKAYFAHLLARKPELMRRMLAFNLGSADSGEDLMRLQSLGMTAQAAFALMEQPRARRHLQQISSCVLPHQWWDFREEAHRLALLEAAVWERLALFTGAALHAPAMARLVRRKDVENLLRTLGSEAGPETARELYEFALGRGTLFPHRLRSYFGGREDLPLALRLRLHGGQALAACSVFWPWALECRLPVTPQTRLPRGESSLLWRAVRHILLREVESSWALCFD